MFSVILQMFTNKRCYVIIAVIVTLSQFKYQRHIIRFSSFIQIFWQQLLFCIKLISGALK